MRTIAHLDLDCFFVSCERIKNPTLIGKAVVVGGSTSVRGVVSSASYEARKFGVRAAMPIGRAKKLCPHAIFLPTDFDLYSFYSQRVRKYLQSVAPVVEQASIDEFYLDLTGCQRMYADLLSFGASVKSYLANQLKLPSSVAIASNKLISKIAANEVKPNGLTRIESGCEAEFLSVLAISKMPGIGHVTEKELSRLGIRTLGELSRAEAPFLKRYFGVWGPEMKCRAAGIDDEPVCAWSEPKSISREITFERDVSDRNYLLSVLSQFSEECAAELRSYGYRARTVTIKFRLPDFRTFERSKTTPAVSFDKDIFSTAERIFLGHWKSEAKLRLIGLGVSNFEAFEPEPELFVDSDKEKENQLYGQVDAIRKRFGVEAIHLGSSLWKK